MTFVDLSEKIFPWKNFLQFCFFILVIFLFLKNGSTRPLFHLFSVFSNKQCKFLHQMYVKKCPSSIWHRDSNPRPQERESPPLTTRPGLPPWLSFLLSLSTMSLLFSFFLLSLSLSLTLYVTHTALMISLLRNQCYKTFLKEIQI